MNTKMMEQVVRAVLEKCNTGNENENNELVKLSYTELYMLFLDTVFSEKEFKKFYKNKYLESVDATLDYLNKQVNLSNEIQLTMKNGEDEYVSVPIFDSISQDIGGYSFRINKIVLKNLADKSKEQKIEDHFGPHFP